jgi:hypothetical protein
MLKVKCPYCGKVHEISVRETYINGVLQDPTTGYAGPSRGSLGRLSWGPRCLMRID